MRAQQELGPIIYSIYLFLHYNFGTDLVEQDFSLIFDLKSLTLTRLMKIIIIEITKRVKYNSRIPSLARGSYNSRKRPLRRSRYEHGGVGYLQI